MADIDDAFCTAPAHQQNAVDLLAGSWKYALPPDAGVVAGTANGDIPKLFDAISRAVGSLRGATVLEIGPFEAHHTRQLEQRGAVVTAIEISRRNFLKCLIVKEALGLNAALLLGDVMSTKIAERYDLVFCAGVLYHQLDPLAMLDRLSAVSDRLYLWTHYYLPRLVRDAHFVPEGNVEVERGAFRCTYHHRRYHLGQADPLRFAGGPAEGSRWLHRTDILGYLEHLGFGRIDLIEDEPHRHRAGPYLALVAQRSGGTTAGTVARRTTSEDVGARVARRPSTTRPPVVFFSVQKSGTNALRKALLLLGMKERPSLSGRNLRAIAGERHIEGGHPIWVDVNAPQPIPYAAAKVALRRFKGGDFASGHVAYDEQLAGLLEGDGFRLLTMLRDPRDVVVSLAKAIAAGKGGHTAWQETFQTMSEEEQIATAITGAVMPGGGPPLVSVEERYRRILGWTRQAHVADVRFERLVGPQGGGSAEAQLGELRRIATHLDLAMDDDALAGVGASLHGGTPTFRRVQIGTWAEAFTPGLLALARVHMTDLLLQLGYESDSGWSEGQLDA